MSPGDLEAQGELGRSQKEQKLPSYEELSHRTSLSKLEETVGGSKDESTNQQYKRLLITVKIGSL